MYIKFGGFAKEIEFCDLEKECWGWARGTLTVIKVVGLEEKFMKLLEEKYGEIIPTIGMVNMFLWRDDKDYIFPQLGITAWWEKEKETEKE